MTIYSQHANRGKVQILATYRGPGGTESSTVTSVGSAELASPLVDVLNRISALATMPLSVFDMRGRRVQSYPVGHIYALTDSAAREGLLNGARGLWYEYVCFELRRALADLDRELEPVPEPVRIAVKAELEKEEQLLRIAVAEHEDGVPAPDTGVDRIWEFGSPFVLFDGGMSALSGEVREKMNEFEAEATDEQRMEAVTDMRVLAAASARCSVDGFHFDEEYLSLFYEPFDDSRLFLTVDAPQPGKDASTSWCIQINRWVPHDHEDEDGSASGQELFSCDLSERPTTESIADLIRRLDREPGLFEKLVEAATVGTPILGTQFVVTAVTDD